TIFSRDWSSDVCSSDLKNTYPANVWPEELPEFKTIALEVYKIIEQAGKDMLKAIALYLELPEDYFEDKVLHGNSILRQIHYFPIENPDEVRSEERRVGKE